MNERYYYSVSYSAENNSNLKFDGTFVRLGCEPNMKGLVGLFSVESPINLDELFGRFGESFSESLIPEIEEFLDKNDARYLKGF